METDILEAKEELLKLKRIKKLLKNNKKACIINIAGESFGLCYNIKMLPVVDYQIKQIKRFLKGKENKWE